MLVLDESHLFELPEIDTIQDVLDFPICPQDFGIS